MPRVSEYTHPLSDGTVVRYSSKVRNGSWSAVYLLPTGKRVEKSTHLEARGKHPPDDFHPAVAKLITASYALTLPSLERITWDDALEEVGRTSPNTRAETLRSFRQGVRAFREVMPDVASPTDLSLDRVTRFGKLFMGTLKANGKARTAATLSYYVRALSAFSNHLVALGHLPRNPWHDAPRVKVKKVKKDAPTEEQFNHFYQWLKSRYPQWHALHALVETKAVTGCRTADLCQLATCQLQRGGLTFTADTTKTGEARTRPLPPDLYGTLRQVAGPTFVWEGAFWQGIRQFRKQSNGLPPAFRWQTVYQVVNNLFAEYSTAHPDRPKLTPHALRRRAITLAVVGLGGNVDAAANVIGVSPQTARAAYLDTVQAFNADADMRRVMEALRPK